MLIEFTVEGKPQGKARARTVYNKNAKRVMSYTPENTRAYEEHIVQSYLTQCEHAPRFFNDEPLEVIIYAGFEIPNSTSKRKNVLMLKHDILPTKKPDIDNIAKVVCDALNGVAYKDDKQIVRLTVSKEYTVYPRLQVLISEV